MGDSFIYGLCDPRTQELRYIGVSKDPSHRLSQHLNVAKFGGSHPKNWMKGLLDVGLRPEMFIIEEIDGSERVRSEQFWITYFRYIGANLTNLTDGGESDFIFSPETRRKISIAKIGNKYYLNRVVTEEYRQKLRDARIGFHFTEEVKQKMSIARKGRRLSEETKRKVAKTSTGRKHSEETKKKISEAKKGNKAMVGRHLSEEWKHKIGEANRRRAIIKKEQPIAQFTVST